MQKIFETLCALCTLLLFSACAQSLIVRSEPPGASVFLHASSNQKQEIGKTPFEIPFRDIEKIAPLTAVTGEMIPLTFENEGYEPMKVLMPPMRTGALSATITVNMKEGGGQCFEKADELLRLLHNAQKIANSGNPSLAVDEVDKALAMNPKFIRALSMKGSLYFVQNRLDDAMTWYQKALSLDSSYDEAIKMIAEIKRRKGVR